MKPEAMVRYTLALVIQLVDAATGRNVYENDVMFHMPPPMKAPLQKTEGTYLFMNMERTDFDFEVSVHGYEPATVRVRFDTIKTQIPLLEVNLIPQEYPKGKYETLTLRGNLPGISEIEAIHLLDVVFSVKDYDKRLKTLTYLNPHGIELPPNHFGLCNEKEGCFEILDIKEEVNTAKVILRSDPAGACATNQSIMRVVYGQTSEDGSYLLKVLDRDPAIYLVRYVVDGEAFFAKVDMASPEPLKKGGGTWELQQ